MLKRLYTGIFKPEEIGKYLKDKVGYVILYILFLSFIVSIPGMISVGFATQADEAARTSFIEKIQQSEFNGQIKDYEYQGEKFEIIEITNTLFFGVKSENINKIGIIVVLENTSFDIYIGNQKIDSFSLKELELETLNFSLKESVDREKLGNALDIIYKEYKTQRVVYVGLAETIGQALLVIVLILMFVALYSLSKPKLLLKYRFILTSYAATVYFLTLLLDNLFGVAFISLIGLFIMGFNLRKAYSRIVQISIVQKRKEQEDDE